MHLTTIISERTYKIVQNQHEYNCDWNFMDDEELFKYYHQIGEEIIRRKNQEKEKAGAR